MYQPTNQTIGFPLTKDLISRDVQLDSAKPWSPVEQASCLLNLDGQDACSTILPTKLPIALISNDRTRVSPRSIKMLWERSHIIQSHIIQELGRSHYTFNSRSHSSIGVATPSRIDSRIPGTESKYSVSCTDVQSASDNNTALLFCPAIRMG
jgi:hypothetical protein